ncbi:MAG: hypothetical protein PHO15_07985 [Eubacteriales bacterium]|nr:hypothetical protein [Eubacteriales bacterium]
MKKILMLSALVFVTVLFAAGCAGAAGELVSSDYDIAHITGDSVLQIEKGMTYEEIFTTLGKTRDAGVGMHVAQYLVDEGSYLNIGYDDMNSENPYSGEEWLDLTVSAIGIRGEVTDISEGEDRVTILVEGEVQEDTMYDKASVTVGQDTVVAAPDGSPLDMGDIKLGDMVEVVFEGPVAESYPVQGTAMIVKILG